MLEFVPKELITPKVAPSAKIAQNWDLDN